jgi:hypothetical protein
MERPQNGEETMNRRLVCIALAAGACGAPVDVPAPGAFGYDAQLSGALWSEWSEPENITGINSAVVELQPTLSPDGLALYFSSGRPGGSGGNDIWVSRRATPDSPWGAPSNLGAAINTAANDNGPSFSNDGHLLFFFSDRPGGQGNPDIYVSRRANTNDDFNWGPPVSVGLDVNTSAYEAAPAYLQNVEEGPANLYFTRSPDGTAGDIFAAPIRRDGTTRGPSYAVAELNFVAPVVAEGRPSVRHDGKEVVFNSNRPGGLGLEDLYVSTRQNVVEEWSGPVNMGVPINSVARDWQPFLSLDGRTLLFISNRPGTLGFSDIYASTRTRLSHQLAP